MQLGEKKIISRVWSLMLEQNEGNNHTSKIYVFSVALKIQGGILITKKLWTK